MNQIADGSTPSDYPGVNDNPTWRCEELDESQIQALQKQAAFRNSSTKFSVRSKTSTQEAKPRIICSVCGGNHQDIKECPNNSFALEDSSYQSSEAAKNLTCHWLCFRKYTCGGKGHLARHHKAELQRSGKFVPGYQRTTFKFTSSSKGKGKRFKGRFPKGKGKGIRAIVDGNDVYLVEEEDENIEEGH